VSVMVLIRFCRFRVGVVYPELCLSLVEGRMLLGASLDSPSDWFSDSGVKVTLTV